MAEFYGDFSGRGGGGKRMSPKDEDLDEEDVWASMMTAKESPSPTSKTRKNLSSSSSRRAAATATPRSIPKADYCGGFSPTQQSSAPVEIPDWSKILKKKSTNNLWDDADEDVDDMVPPHEYLARRLASTKIASFSMCEGVGRTLKGRDLSKLRNAILTKTGFLE